jgi:hypothetical protein
MFDRQKIHPPSDWFLLALLIGYFALLVIGAALVIVYYESHDVRAAEREIERTIRMACQSPK